MLQVWWDEIKSNLFHWADSFVVKKNEQFWGGRNSLAGFSSDKQFSSQEYFEMYLSEKCNFNNLNGNVHASFLSHQHSPGWFFGLPCTECKLCERLMRIFFFRYLWPQWQKYFWWRNALLPPKSHHVKIQHAILCPVTRVRHQPGGWGGCSFSSGSIRRVTTPCSLTRFSYGSRFVLVSFGF